MRHLTTNTGLCQIFLNSRIVRKGRKLMGTGILRGGFIVSSHPGLSGWLLTEESAKKGLYFSGF